MARTFKRRVRHLVRTNYFTQRIGQVFTLGGRDIAIGSTIFDEEGHIISRDIVHRVMSRNLGGGLFGPSISRFGLARQISAPH
jgi:hypothetical protein